METPGNTKKTVLVVMKSVEDCDTLARTLGPESYNFITAHSGIEAISNMTYHVPSIIVSEVDLPELNGYELCKKIRTGIKTKLIPFVFISYSDRIDDRIAALKTGADAYLVKPYNPQELKVLVESRIKLFDEFYKFTVTDELTRLYNRREFLKRFNLELENPNTEIISLCILDLDHFKKINDTYGHQTGDIVLMKLADVLNNYTSESLFPARFGGEEFVILFPGISASISKGTVDAIRENLLSIGFQRPGGENTFNVSFSAGIAEYPSMASNISELLSRSDQALYAAKNDGRGRTYIFSPLMARNDRFWEYLKSKKRIFLDSSHADPVTSLPFLPQVLEHIINLDFEVKSIGVLTIKAAALCDIESLRGMQNLHYDIENIKNIILWACEFNFPSDIYLSVSNFFEYEFTALFPSIVDFSHNVDRFNELCREIEGDIVLSSFSYLHEISFSSDVIYFKKESPRKLLSDIARVEKRVHPLENKKELFLSAAHGLRHVIDDGAPVDSVIELRHSYSLFTLEPTHHYFAFRDPVIKSDLFEVFLGEAVTGRTDLEVLVRGAIDLFDASIEKPILFPWIPAMTPGEYARLISSFAGDKEIILLINEVKVQLMGVEEFSGLVGSIPENVSIGLDNCYLGNDILNYLSLIDFRIACLSEHIIRNLHLFPERIKIINGLKLFTDELGIPLLARNILVEEEFQIIRDLRIPFATGAYLAALEQSDPQ